MMPAVKMPAATASFNASAFAIPNQGPRFGSSGSTQQLITSAMEFLDQNKIRELILTDLFLMVLPRTLIEGTLRDKRAKFDAIREALIREILTTVAMVFTMPVIGHGLQKLFDKVPLLNPKGLSTGAWVNEILLKRFHQLLNETVTGMPPNADVQTLRSQFLDRALKEVQNGDQRLVEKLDALAPGTNIKPDLGALLPNLKQLFEKNRDPASGIFPVETVVDELLQHYQRHSATVQTIPDPSKLGTLRRQLKCKENQALLKYDEAWMAHANQVLDAHQFGSSLKIRVNGNGARTLSRSELLLSLRNFTQEVVDRVSHDLAKASPMLKTVNQQAFIQEADNLVKHLHRSKWLLTWLPLGLALYFGRSLPVISNAITRSLHGGKKYFPGDVALIEAESMATSQTAVLEHPSTPLNNRNIFDAFSI